MVVGHMVVCIHMVVGHMVVCSHMVVGRIHMVVGQIHMVDMVEHMVTCLVPAVVDSTGQSPLYMRTLLQSWHGNLRYILCCKEPSIQRPGNLTLRHSRAPSLHIWPQRIEGRS